ncbi:Heat shock protein DnaJ [Cordyceps fumosorosea ARSEF 2679]|uniref:Heat shock protein DnaJ n=1 Tax=Cordyceps fumosorosea (strain ARSEF 2679) TaxID=1081104 RepID=A0A167SW28_CORFA|nr:Heat shock protein DnaJ [Cordyceps fumosorosea ARSEF 2679]OAA59985.1 Heat shock protein DnaJ [Cordyceps fumosorosea ARSEF 2679]
MHFSQAVRNSHKLFATTHQRSNGKRQYSGSGHHQHNPQEASPPRITWPTEPQPTPYRILGLEAGRPYAKANFNRLVKMYHPDMGRHHRSNNDHDAVSPQAQLHRYLLVVAAHDLLSDPSRRRRYDLHGLGWMAGTRSNAAAAAAATTGQRRREADWRQDTEPSPLRQAPIYMSNHAFAILALMLALGYAIVSCERVRRAARREDARRTHVVDGDAVRALYGAQYLVQGRSKDERILAFLCRRHVAAGGGDGDGVGFVPFDKDWEQNICRH